jgi:hypothetical protein
MLASNHLYHARHRHLERLTPPLLAYHMSLFLSIAASVSDTKGKNTSTVGETKKQLKGPGETSIGGEKQPMEDERRDFFGIAGLTMRVSVGCQSREQTKDEQTNPKPDPRFSSHSSLYHDHYVSAIHCGHLVHYLLFPGMNLGHRGK